MVLRRPGFPTALEAAGDESGCSLSRQTGEGQGEGRFVGNKALVQHLFLHKPLVSNPRTHMLLFHKGLTVALAALLAAPMAAAQLPVAPSQATVTPVQIVLVDAERVTPVAVSQWRQERFKGVAVVLDEQTGK